MTVDIDLIKGTATQRINEKDPDSTFFAQNEQVNEYMAEKVVR